MFDGLWFADVLIAFIAAALGGLVGIGGGLLLVPWMWVRFPEAAPTWIVSVSLLCVSLNALSAGWTYVQKKLLSWPHVWRVVPGAFMGAVVGALILKTIDRTQFAGIFGILALFSCAWLIYRSVYPIPAFQVTRPLNWIQSQILLLFAFFAASLSSMVGVGGGVLMVPFAVFYLRLSIYQGVALSQIFLLSVGVFATGLHFYFGHLNVAAGIQVLIFLPGLLLGSQLGSRMSSRVQGVWVLRLLALVLLIIAYRMLVL